MSSRIYTLWKGLIEKLKPIENKKSAITLKDNNSVSQDKNLIFQKKIHKTDSTSTEALSEAVLEISKEPDGQRVSDLYSSKSSNKNKP